MIIMMMHDATYDAGESIRVSAVEFKARGGLKLETLIRINLEQFARMNCTGNAGTLQLTPCTWCCTKPSQVSGRCAVQCTACPGTCDSRCEIRACSGSDPLSSQGAAEFRRSRVRTFKLLLKLEAPSMARILPDPKGIQEAPCAYGRKAPAVAAKTLSAHCRGTEQCNLCRPLGQWLGSCIQSLTKSHTGKGGKPELLSRQAARRCQEKQRARSERSKAPNRHIGFHAAEAYGLESIIMAGCKRE